MNRDYSSDPIGKTMFNFIFNLLDLLGPLSLLLGAVLVVAFSLRLIDHLLPSRGPVRDKRPEEHRDDRPTNR